MGMWKKALSLARICAIICNMWKLSAPEGELWSEGPAFAWIIAFSRLVSLNKEAGCVLWAHKTTLVASRHDLRRLPSLVGDNR